MPDGSDARLEVVIGARLDGLEEKLDRAVRAVNGAGGKMRRKIDDVDSQWQRLFGKTDPLMAIDKVFDRTRFTLLDTAGAKIGLFGSALESLGPAGLVAAAGIGAVAGAAAAARQSLAFADEISDSAAKVGIGTTALQEWRYAVHAAGGEAQDADAAIKGFTEVLGAAKSELSPRAMKPFAALGFTREQLDSFEDAEALLQEVIKRISELSDEDERQAVAAKLGLTPMIPLLRQGAEAADELRAAAHRLGYVMDEDVIAKAGEANDKLEALDQVIRVQLATSFAELAPFIVKATEALADFLKAAAGLAREAHRLEGLGKIAKAMLGNDADLLMEGLADLTYQPLPADFGMDVDDPDAIRHARRPSGGRRLAPPGKGAKKKTSTLGPYKPADDSDLISPYDPVTGRLIKPPTDQDLAFEQIFGFRPGDEPKAVKVDATVNLKPTLDEAWRAHIDELRQSVQGAWEDALYAAMDGDLWDFIKQKLFQAGIEGLGRVLTNWTMQGAQAGGDMGAILRFAGSLLGIPGLAEGTDNARAGLYEVGEHGRELLRIPRGSQVIPHNRVSAALGAGGSVINNHYYLDGAVMADDLWARIDAGDARATIVGSRLGSSQALDTLRRAQRSRLGR